MSAENAHLSALTLERLAEEDLPQADAAVARSHIAECMRCAAEFEAYEMLFARLGNLPRFAPSPAFADAVIARVQIAPQESRAVAWLRRFVPSSRRGWAFVGSAMVIPSLPIVAILVMMLTQPLLSPVTLGQWGMLRLESLSQATLAWLFDRAVTTGLYGFGEAALTTIQNVPMAALAAALAMVSIAIPLSGWGLVRLTRTPMRSATYAK